MTNVIYLPSYSICSYTSFGMVHTHNLTINNLVYENI